MTAHAGVRSDALLKNPHPGDILRHDFLEPLGMTPYRLAKRIGVPQTRITAILAGQRAVTADTALRLGRLFGIEPQFWLALQTSYDLEEARRAGVEAELERIETLAEAA